jgi:hypothetical protein
VLFTRNGSHCAKWTIAIAHSYGPDIVPGPLL